MTHYPRSRPPIGPLRVGEASAIFLRDRIKKVVFIIKNWLCHPALSLLTIPALAHLWWGFRLSPKTGLPYSLFLLLSFFFFKFSSRHFPENSIHSFALGRGCHADVPRIVAGQFHMVCIYPGFARKLDCHQALSLLTIPVFAHPLAPLGWGKLSRIVFEGSRQKYVFYQNGLCHQALS